MDPLMLAIKASRNNKKKKRKQRSHQTDRFRTVDVHPSNKPFPNAIPLSHYHCDMIGHILLNTAQKTRGQDRDTPKGNTAIVHPFVRLSVRELARPNDHLICLLVACDARNLSNLIQQRGACELNCVRDVLDVGDIELGHRAADVVLRRRYEFRDEDIIINAVADAATDNTDRERECGNSGNEVLEER